MTAITDEKWFALEIVADPAGSEAIEFALNEFEALGTEINNLGKKDAETLTIVGYFNTLPDNAVFQVGLANALEIYELPANTIKQTSWRNVENQDWLAEWKKHWRPTVTDKFVIAPPWDTVDDENRIVIKIEPSMAFGTGTHETTRLCLRAIEQNFSPEMSFLDVGTGTGILAIAAAKLKVGAAKNASGKILGCDTDTDSIKIAVENAELNDVPGIEFYVGPIDAETPDFDFVCANLTADVIVPILPLLTAKYKKVLVLSGILKEQEEWVTANLPVGQYEVEQDGEWISIIIKTT